MRSLVVCALLLATSCAEALQATPCPSTIPPPADNVTYRLNHRYPPSCQGSECTYVLGIGTNHNSNYLDIHVEAVAEAWAAVGFSLTASMFDTNAVGCVIYSGDDHPTVVDTWNPSSPTRNNLLNANQSVVCTHSSEFVNGRISCVLSRLIAKGEGNNDYSLNDDYWLLFGFGNTTQGNKSNAFTQHQETPKISSQKFNPTLDYNSCPSSVAPPPSNVSYRLTHRSPSGCHGSGCTYILGIRTNENPKFLDIYVEADAHAWAAVGFTKTPDMYDTNAVGCVIYTGDDHPTVVDTWNPSSPTRNNLLNTDQSVVCTHRAEYTDGRVSCVLSRLIDSRANGDFDLDKEYYLLFGYGTTKQDSRTQAFTEHQHTPGRSSSKVNPTSHSGEVGEDSLQERLIRSHGILMLLAYPVLAGTGVFFAAWMKPVLRNGQWFQVHRFLMMASLVVGVVAFMLVFVAHRDESFMGYKGLVDLSKPKSAAHFAIGIMVIILQLTNPLIAIVRCKPDSSSRWIFDWLHGKTIGYLCKFLAGIGISLALSVHSAAFAVYIAFVGYELLLYGVLFVVTMVMKFMNKGYSPLNKTKESPINEDGVSTANSNPLVWAGLVLFLAVVPTMVAVAVLIGVEDL